ncbi:fimbria/pilus periplasmic chaperone [Deefgea tanakiae]|uniref:Fimbria/pilus periplasmic chaperone n=1 Tax=Deefgea tanakiae TaxID=2865840 RepID=A0ABX8Z5J9_9NEIS|nr:fimbria/pilus periplasmic chaperone [Deefgea tanakiae]QZA77857.1 fimbria/pilus periplasmic chaperone [Deefgea tanakiae]
MHYLLALFFSLSTVIVQAGEFSISPIRVDFDSKTKSQAITVSNQGDAPLRIALQLKKWTQNEAADDVYTDAQQDLIYFPRQFELQAKQKQVVRIARKTPSQDQESAYRLYFNEQPSASSDSAQSGNVSMVVSFGVPLFFAASKPSPSLIASPIQIEKQTINFKLSNNGNSTQKLRRIQFGQDGVEIAQFDHWYLLPGASHAYQLDLPKDACRSEAQIITIETDRSRIKQTLDIPLSVCKP